MWCSLSAHNFKNFPGKNIGNKYIYPSIEGNNANIPVMNKNGRSGVKQETERDSNLVLQEIAIFGMISVLLKFSGMLGITNSDGCFK